MVGHTHEDIDQTFSCVSRYLRKNDDLTVPGELHSFLFKTWLSPCLEEIHGHTVPHVFLFRRGLSGKSLMFYTNWSHDQWEPLNGLKPLNVYCISYIVLA